MINKFRASLTEKQQLTNDQFIFRFSLIEPKEINFKAGQYLILKINGQSRLYSIYSPDYLKNSLELMIKIVSGGLASNYLNNLKVGDKVEFQGPAGVFSLKENEKEKVFLATFTGLAPLRSMILSYLEKNKNRQKPNLYLYWGVKNYQDICLVDELKQLTINNPNLKLFLCLSRESNLDKIPAENREFFHIGHVNQVWEESFKQSNNVTMQQFINYFDYYLCGSRDVVESLNQYLLDKRVNQTNIIFEKF